MRQIFFETGAYFKYTEEKVIKGAVFNIYGDIDCDYIFEHFICPGITP